MGGWVRLTPLLDVRGLKVNQTEFKYPEKAVKITL